MDYAARMQEARWRMPEHGIDRKQVVSMDRYSLLAVIAAREAMRQSGLTAHADNTYRMGGVVGVGVGSA